MTTPAELAARVKRLGRAHGFDLVAIARADRMEPEGSRYVEWVAEGRHAAMAWITPERATRSADPRSVLPEAQSVICAGLSYWSGARPQPSGRGKVARYAWGEDYHRVLGDRLRALAADIEESLGGRHRPYVDTGPLMDKALAARSGMGWYGKNTNILTSSHGSFVLLGEIVTSLDLAPDPPLRRDCGACRLCLVACPTGALGPDYSIDSRKCISYLTIEHRGPIPRHLRPLMADWVFGCDICQDVCPPAVAPYLKSANERREWSSSVRHQIRSSAERDERRDGGGGLAEDGSGSGQDMQNSTALPPPPDHPLFRRGSRPDVDLVWLLGLTHAEYVEAFRGTALRRAKVWMLRRNAAVALGNVGDAEALPPLHAALLGDDEPVVRGHAAWAIGRIGCRLPGLDTAAMLRAALQDERDGTVQEEIRAALQEPPATV